jgi:hypothetical protein
MIVDGRLPPAIGAELICSEGEPADHNDHPLLPYRGLLGEFQDWRPDWNVAREVHLERDH